MSQSWMAKKALLASAIAGAFAMGLMADVKEYFAVVKYRDAFERDLQALSKEEKELLENQANARNALQKKLEPVIGKNPFDAFALRTAQSPITDPRIASGWKDFKNYQDRFAKEAAKRFPKEWGALRTMEINASRRLDPKVSSLQGERMFKESGKGVMENHRKALIEKAKLYGKGAGIGVLFGAGVGLIKRGKRNQNLPARRFNRPR